MKITQLPDNPYLLLTPGPLSTSKGVKAAMLRDWCTWDDEYNDLVQEIRRKLVRLAGNNHDDYTSVLMQGSGTFSVEAVIGSAVPDDGKLLILTNGAYGNRIVQIARVLKVNTLVIDFGEVSQTQPEKLQEVLEGDPEITHVAVVHCETTTGMLNPIAEVGKIAKAFGKVLIVDAMSSFGGVEIDAAELEIDFLISSANKCIQGVPGFGFILAKTEELKKCKGRARSLSLDLYDQWETMETYNGKWRYTSPTHVVRAFYQAMLELEEEGGVKAREIRYRENQRTLVDGMEQIGFRTLLPRSSQSPIITSFYYPESAAFTFHGFYERLKKEGFVIYPGKISLADTFRIGNIGEVYPHDMKRLVEAIDKNRFW
ncbi:MULTISPECIES: 2-aminoethylphosphonate--pyruvate transaminase [Brevibacillus]|uniref:2-aminoethylphosphonate--pyruvate transaminase n=1 Tax=Brevibacillus borstelensis AK1 TaxID=1300222 RepID=M8DAM0_9BACL|nr:2-aminoethylphosphonate--pyruvate transaminase [Brevibacillus borstelensis]EMT53329.1 2-aminoethylphosphonate-pyruvate aminotransferase [Brevibacillus borstelensis AK1]KKX53771.1 2-aminoethylphosphonate--pyruvate aminotransferase [Brevibacillus borstelensis cifa_chp40]MBE5396382.1 2-aminoethylphosphonate--pyruvate transaminase [Brevibacillus borstelensis]MCC0565736.1 2-aminoethylphosphonate--pyruvate transaminase [Brevibacillus borstelensis]MCM3472525.1 2-aminoethylphosphonate--pyruvate tra